jgi:hypothetical protein
MIVLALLVPLGIAASTVATVVSERAEAACPDKVDGCTTAKDGEPVIVALVDASDPSTAWPLREAIPESVTGMLPGEHPVRIDLLRPRCSAEAAAHDVRELASDPPEEPPAALVIAAACDDAAVPMAQILSDREIPLVMLSPVAPIPTDPGYLLVAPQLDLQVQAAGLQGVGIVSHLADLLTRHVTQVLDDSLAAIERVVILDGHELLIPRARLRDQLIDAGFSPA